MNAALELAGRASTTHLVERDAALGGNARLLRITAQGEEVQAYWTADPSACWTSPCSPAPPG